MSLLTRIRLYHFLLFGGNAFIHPFLGLFFVRVGLIGAEIGLLDTLTNFAGLVAALAWGHWGERQANPRIVLRFVLIATALLHVVLSQQETFLILAVLLVINSLLTASIFPLSNIFTLQLSGTGGYGSVRLWGSLGWAILVLVAGWLIEQLDLTVGFLGYAVLFIAAAGILPHIMRAHPHETPNTPQSFRAGLRNIIGSRALMGLVVATCLQYLAMGPIYRFEPIYLDDLGATETLIGFASTIGALIELPFMFWADRWIRVQGAGRILRMGLLMHMVRMIAVLLFPNMLVIVAMHLVHGIAYALITVALVVFISENSPPNQATTVMALFMVTLPALTGIVGAPIGGMIYDALGAYWLYGIGLIGLALAWLALRVTREPLIPKTASVIETA